MSVWSDDPWLQSEGKVVPGTHTLCSFLEPVSFAEHVVEPDAVHLDTLFNTSFCFFLFSFFFFSAKPDSLFFGLFLS